jgi:AraC-like DNA-binding protein
MTPDTSSDRLAFVVAAHHFVRRALPLRLHESELALQEFLEDPTMRSASESARDAVLLRCLRILDGHSTCLPSLVTRYLRRCDPRDSVSRFQVCVRDMLRSLGIGDPRVQQALGIIEKRHGNAALTQREVALAVGLSPSTFSMQFGRLTGLTFSEYVRSRRLAAAATLLATSTLAIKEIWASVGYNHASNFDHDFKRRFGQTPRAYRAGSRCTPSATPADGDEPVVDSWTLDGAERMCSEERSRERLELVTAGHHFLLDAFPLRHPNTTAALDSFVERAKRTPLSELEMDAVLLRILCAIDRRSGDGLPTLVDQYLAEPHPADCVTRFAACVRRRLRSRGIGDPRIQQVVAIIDERYVDSRLALRTVALEVGVDAAVLASLFKAETGLTCIECLRRRRLDRGADLLITTNMTVKEVWAAVGYNHASNFGRDFRRRFESSPREYRARAVRGAHDPRPIELIHLHDMMSEEADDEWIRPEPLDRCLGRGDRRALVDIERQRTSAAGDVLERRRADPSSEVSGLSSAKFDRADVAHHVPGDAAVGALDQAAGGVTADAALAHRSQRRRAAIQE